ESMNSLSLLSPYLEVPISMLVFVKQLGSGSHGETYVVKYKDRLSCAKICRQMNDMVQEALMLKAAASSGRCPKLLGICSSLSLVLMDLAPGQTLHSLLKSHPCKVFIHRVMTALGKAIENLHRSGVIHNDLKFDNIMVSTDNLKPRITLIDFGWATFRKKAPYSHISSEVMSNYRHVSPKLAFGGECDNNTDNYSFGILLRAVANDCKCPLFSMIANVLTRDEGVMHSLGDLMRYIKDDACMSCRQSCVCVKCKTG
ncbi:Serine-threonine/tyrosine-protein kinase catalytic domain, partial [Trinorchestia longiramus]